MSKSYVLVTPGWGDRHAVLRRGDEEVGRLDYDGMLGARARASSGGAEWSFERTGMLQPVVTVHRGGELVVLMRIRVGGGCELTLENGRKLQWKAISVLRGELGWVGEDGAPVITYRPRISARAIEQDIELLEDHLPAETERLLLLLGSYLTKIVYTDVATTTAAVMAATVIT